MKAWSSAQFLFWSNLSEHQRSVGFFTACILLLQSCWHQAGPSQPGSALVESQLCWLAPLCVLPWCCHIRNVPVVWDYDNLLSVQEEMPTGAVTICSPAKLPWVARLVSNWQQHLKDVEVFPPICSSSATCKIHLVSLEVFPHSACLPWKNLLMHL